ncbi:serine/threonine-protein phosphatase 6 regulatory ankyrin repeat subunit B-like protein [Leptotrombidium deliense]|uniref:Alpha-latrotoxin n=1 Tax=Leptotrombidium deliense TaxID=299467 RepID=A0A443RS95_9ACAR|nr:serine/threonine-protein phosphatase 6 regulatory ankyrin repeat subunit B-like protein [Leptotrombidium deliense]
MIVESETYMHYACHSGNLFLVDTLIEKNPDLHKPNGIADFPIHNAAKNGHNDTILSFSEKIETLDVNIRGERSQTSLHYAINYANLSTIELIISKKFNFEDK